MCACEALQRRVTFFCRWGVASMTWQCGKQTHQRFLLGRPTNANMSLYSQQTFRHDGAVCRHPREPLEPEAGAIVCESSRWLAIFGMANPRGWPIFPPAWSAPKHALSCFTRDRGRIDTPDALHVRMKFCRWWDVAAMTWQCGTRPHAVSHARRPTAANVSLYPQQKSARDGEPLERRTKTWRRSG